MRFRCAQCRALTPVVIPARLEAPLVVPCTGCGRSYRFAVDRPRGTGDQERYRRARSFSETNRIDLASAYSVLEGIMSLEDAQALRPGGAKPAAPGSAASSRSAMEEALREAVEEERPAGSSSPAAAARSSPTVRTATPRSGAAPALSETEVPYDPGFAGAVREGRLTPQQALERGDRRTLALRLSQRHRLPMELALRVADNRITVQKALLHKAAIESREPPPSQISVSHGVWNFMVYTVGALILAGLGVHIFDVWGDYRGQQGQASLIVTPAAASARQAAPAPAAAPPEPPPALTVPRTDATGQLIEVLGPDPKSVLVAFCRSGRQAGQREPVEISPTVPPDAAARWGLFRSVGALDTPIRAILIRKDPRTGRWSAGDGRSPITTVPAPELPPGTRTIPISASGLARDLPIG